MMKLNRIICVLLLMPLISFGGIVIHATQIISTEDFNDMQISIPPSSPWTFSGVDAAKSSIIVSRRQDNTDDLCLEVNDNDNSKSAVAILDFDMLAEDCTISFQYLFKKGGGQPATVTVLEKGVWPPAITLMANTNLSLFNGSTNSNVKEGVSADAWHTIVFHIYPSQGTYDTYLDEIKISTGLLFRNSSLHRLNRIQLGLGTSGTAATCYYDNLVIEKGIRAMECDRYDAIKIIPSYVDMQAALHQKMKDAIALTVGGNNALVRGAERIIDKHSNVDETVRVPLDFIAESFSGTAEWHQASNTASVNVGGKMMAFVIGSHEVIINGSPQAIPNSAYINEGKVYVPLLPIASAIEKKVFLSSGGLIVISDTENILNSELDSVLIDALMDLLMGGREINSFSKYSSTFYSSRWFREDGGVDPWEGFYSDLLPKSGTIKTARQMMLTNDLWTYSNSTYVKDSDFDAWAESGVLLQGALPGMLYPAETPQDVLQNGVNRDFDGNTINAPWVGAGESRPGGSATSEVYFQYMKQRACLEIDKGIFSFQHDDWLLDVQYAAWGGGFDPSFTAYFKEYLRRNYTTAQLSGLGVDNIDTFQYKTYLQQKLGATSNADYLAKRSLSKLDSAFKDCCIETTIKYHIRMRQELNIYAGRTIAYSVNAPLLRGIHTDYALANDIIDFQFGEAPDGTYTPINIAAWGSTMTAMGKSSVILPLPLSVDGVKKGLAAAYANGQYLAFPWDVYIGWNTPRYFGQVDDYAKEYHFIRQYEELFNDFEIPATIGVLAKRSAIEKTTFENTVAQLVEASIPFKSLISNEKYPKMEFVADDLVGLSYIVAYTPLSQFSAAEQQIIQNSGAVVIDPAMIPTIIGSEKAVSATASGTVYTFLREKNINSRVIHVLNQTSTPLNNIELTIKDKYIPADAVFTYYRPGFDPVILQNNNGSVLLPVTEYWGIVELLSEEKENALQEGMSFLNIGSPATGGTANFANKSLTLTSKGMGTNLGVQNDNGSFDQIAFAYKHMGDTANQSMATVACFESTTDPTASVGIMDRKTPASNSPFVGLVIEGGELKLKYRDKYDAHTISEKLKDVSFPIYLKLIRQGNTYTAYSSYDGISFGNAIATKELSLTGSIGGVFASSSNDKVAGSVTISHLAFKNLNNLYELVLSNAEIDDGYASLDVKIINPYDEMNLQTTLYISIYDQNTNRLIGIKQVPVCFFEHEKSITENLSILSLRKDGHYKMKVMLWDNQYVPLSATAEWISS